jgi:hypothetical protein
MQRLTRPQVKLHAPEQHTIAAPAGQITGNKAGCGHRIRP